MGFVQQINKWAVAEAAVDCQRCSVSTPLRRDDRPRPYKCCSFQPFWSAFFVGACLDANQWSLEKLLDPNSILLPVGVVPPSSKRCRQNRLSSHTRSGDRELVCSYFDLSSGQCGVFAYRPLECRRYFCASVPRQQKYRDFVYHHLAGLQADLLRQFILENNYSDNDWNQWIEFLEPDGFSCQPTKAFANIQIAENFYLSAHRWLSENEGDIEWPPLPMLDQWHESNKRTPIEIG